LARRFHVDLGMKHIGHSRSLFAWTLIALVVLPLTFGACGKSVGETIDDATITARVKTALLNDPQVGGMKIDVDTTMGVVTMSGIVKSDAEAARAVQLARQASGVKDVKSTLQVNPGG
jgi:osmotically-inducible protein OsmY